MGKLKLDTLSNGYLANIIVEAGLKEMLDEYELVGVLGRTREETELLTKKSGCQACGAIDELLTLSPDCVAETASIQPVKDYGVKIPESGAGMAVLFAGAFVDHEFFGQIRAAAADHKVKVYIASGAVGGFDVLQIISFMGQTEAGTRTRKGPASLKGTPLFIERLTKGGTESHVFHGNTKETISLLPIKVSVAMAPSLVTAGPEDTRVDIYSVPGMVGDDHKTTSEVEGVKAVVDIYSGTSAVTG